jgi:hypothetical protein
MNFAKCEVCPSLRKEIKSLTRKLEQASNIPMVFAMDSKDEICPFKRPYKKYSHVKHNKNHNKFHGLNIRCYYCGRSGHTTSHCHIRKVEVPKGLIV